MPVKIITKSQEFVHAALFEVEVGTTGLRGGDSGNGGRTYLRFTDRGGTDMTVDVAPDGDSLSLVFGGDAELENLIEGLQFAIDVLKESREHGTVDNLPKSGSRTVK